MNVAPAETELAPARLGLRGWIVANGPALIGLLVFAAALWPLSLLNDSDSWWHLSAGDWILAHGTVPRTDPFSYSFAGQPWIAHEWLAEIPMSLAYAWAGWPGLMLLTAAAFGLSAWLLAREAGRYLQGLPLWLTLLAGLTLFGPHLLARPHILVLPLVVIWFAGLIAARRDRRAPSPWLLLVMILWANMHGGFIAGIAMVAPFALEALLDDRTTKAFRDWALFGLGALIAGTMTPYGLDGLIFPLRLIAMSNLAGIGEWAPLSFASLQPLHVVVLAFALFWLMRRPKIGLIRWLVLLALLAASIRTQRHEMLLGVLGILILAEPIGAVLAQRARERAPHWSGPALGLVAVALAVLRLSLPISAPVNDKDPARALTAVPPALAGQHVFNAYDFGGYLIRAGIAPFIDSRADMYGDAFLDQYSKLIAGNPDDLRAAFDRYDVAWTMLKPGTPMAEAMSKLEGWRELYADPTAIIHVRTPS